MPATTATPETVWVFCLGTHLHAAKPCKESQTCLIIPHWEALKRVAKVCTVERSVPYSGQYCSLMNLFGLL